MKTYVAIRDSWGYRGQLWVKGQQVKTDELPNEHFKVVSTDVEKAQAAANEAARVAKEAADKAKALVEAEEKKTLDAAAEKITGKKQ